MDNAIFASCTESIWADPKNIWLEWVEIQTYKTCQAHNPQVENTITDVQLKKFSF